VRAVDDGSGGGDGPVAEVEPRGAVVGVRIQAPASQVKAR
jgi:hypothetical protein